MKPCESGNLVFYCDFSLSVPLYKVFVALIAFSTSNREHAETPVPHHIEPAGCHLYAPNGLSLHPPRINARLSS